ncbi:hypothetical protein M9978_02340 [Sphingomonas sp. MG17]|uniref:Uncharacterized protein n=1 Tax=Sphingomonas tagetis TaxID=2949092 RepID=A0A9X2HNU9_9SPHN|nr:hypothetical protein [Sphingomonas tagetis]MCP3729255.1 hypothetical protein [Sphingomonas tagetis]
MRSRIDGVNAVLSTFDALPEAARDEMAVEIGLISREISAAQKADVPTLTGATQAALTFQLQLEQLRSRVGLLKGSSSRGSRNNFVGRMIEHGRDAQTVLVTRRVKKRRITGNGTESKREVAYLGPKKRRRPRSSPNRGTFVGDPYKLRVRAKAARPFVAQPILQDVGQQHLSEYASRLLGRVGAR